MSTSRILGLIVDDEPAARRGIRLLLQGDPDIDIVGECSNGPQAVAAIERYRPDLVFLDVQMPGMNGFDVLTKVPEQRQPQVVFVTAYDKYALAAFEVQAIDYLLKPFSDRRFYTAVERAKVRIQRRELSFLSHKLIEWLQHHQDNGNQEEKQADMGKQEYLERLAIKSPHQILFVSVQEIDWIEAVDDYLQLHVGVKTHLFRDSMNEIEKKLNPKQFVRIHRSTMVNLERIRQLQPYFRGEYRVILHNDTKLRLARRRRKQLEKALQQKL